MPPEQEPSVKSIKQQVASHDYFKYNLPLINNILNKSKKFNGISLGGTNTSIPIIPYSCLGNLYLEPVQEPVQELVQEPVQKSIESFTIEKLDNNTFDISNIICIIIIILLITVVVLGIFCGFKINM